MKQLCKKGGALCLAVALLLTLLAGCQGEAEQSTGETPQDTTQSATDTTETTTCPWRTPRPNRRS